MTVSIYCTRMWASVWLIGVFVNLVYAECPTPDDISFGTKTVTANTVVYTCDAGYVMTSGDAVHTCVGDSWSGTIPTCTDMDDLFSFMCDVEGNILAINPDPSSLKYVQAVNPDGPCTTTMNSNGTVTISGCDTDKEIAIVFSPNLVGMHSPEFITARVKYYNITCLSIGFDGIHIYVTDDTWVQNLVSTTLQAPEIPSVMVESEIYGFGESAVTGPPVAGIGDNSTYFGEVEINQKLRWRLFTEKPYLVKPVNCTAYSGYISSINGRLSTVLFQDGCAVVPIYLTQFDYDDPPNKDSVIADVYAFKYEKSDTVEIICAVMVCPPESTECDFTCDKRRKRSEPDVHIEPDINIIEGNMGLHTDEYSDFHKNPQHSPTTTNDPMMSVREGRAHFAFRVNGPPTLGMEYFSHSSRREMQKYGVLLSTLLSLLLCMLR